MAFALNQDSVVKKLGDVDRMLSDWESSQILNAFVPNPHSPNQSPTQGTSPQHSTGFRGSYSPVFQDMATAIDETMTGTATINNPNLSATLHTQLGNLMRLENEVQQNKREVSRLWLQFAVHSLLPSAHCVSIYFLPTSPPPSSGLSE
jgi:hypothetical protein